MSQLNVVTVDTNAASDLLLKRNGTTKLTVGSGTVTLADTLTTNGIAFPATQSASSDANTLDDYEEGTCTLALSPASGTITMDTGFNPQKYTKIGNQVTVTGFIYVSSVSSPTGALTITGLPFTLPNTDGNRSGVAISPEGLNSVANIVADTIKNTSTVKIYSFAAGAKGDAASLIKSASNFSLTITYFI